jgi:negative regulator of flagellin synthesis FlgM
MEIPSDNIRINKSRTVQDRAKVGDKKSVTQSEGGTSATNGSEQIAISSKAKDIQKATEAVNVAPDIRVEKVDKIKDQIANGNYRVSSEQLAEKVLENIITESKFLG